MEIGFGIVGCGMIADFHSKAIADIDGANLVACYNRTFDKAVALADKVQGCTAYNNLDAMLSDPRVNIVTICTASGAHLKPAIAAAKAGKHVIVEKPLEVTVERCDEIITACKENNVKLATIFPSRFHEASRLMKDAIDAKKFGTLTMGDAYVKWFRTQEYYDSGAWRGTWELDGGGALMNQAIHSVDLLLWMMGDVAEVSAFSATLAHERIEVEDVVTATLKFKNGALGVIEATTASFPGSLKKIEIHGSTGSAILEEEDIIKWDFAEPTAEDESILKKMMGKTETGGGASDPSAIGHAAHTAQFQDFVKAIDAGTQPLIDGSEGRRSVELILAIYESAKTGQRVKL